MPSILMTAIIGATAALLGALIGAFVSVRSQREARAHQFRREQLDRFYGPLVAMRTQIRILSELRVRIETAAGAAWHDNVAGQTAPVITQFRGEYGEEFRRITEDENARLNEQLLPTYNRMVRLFVARYWLAEPSTREHLPALMEYVDLWRRWQAKALPAPVLEKLDHSEAKMHPLYDDLQMHLDRLRGELATGR